MNPSKKSNIDQLKELTESLIDRDFLLKRRQFMFEQLLSSSPVPVLVWVIDNDYTFIHNGGSLPSLGITESDQYLGTSVFDYFKTESKEDTPLREITHCLETGREMTYDFYHNNRNLMNRCSPLKNYSNEVVGLVGITWDVTEIYSMKDILFSIENENSLSDNINKKIRNLKSSIEKICKFK